MELPDPILPPLGDPEIPVVKPELLPHIISRGLLTDDESAFFKKNKICLTKDAQKLLLGPAGELIIVGEIHNLRMTNDGADGPPAIIFHQVPSNREIRAKTWVLSFPPQVPIGQPLLIRTSDELRAIAKAIVSGRLDDFKFGRLEEAYDYNDTEEYPTLPNFSPKKKTSLPLQTAPAGGGKPPPHVPSVAVASSGGPDDPNGEIERLRKALHDEKEKSKENARTGYREGLRAGIILGIFIGAVVAGVAVHMIMHR